jgi:inner membrane protein
MENVTHSLIGVALGEGVLQLRRMRGKSAEPISPALRAGVLWAAVLGSNLPDSDILLKPFVGGGSLGSLLHHRGFTHTVALSLPLAAVAALAGLWVARARTLVSVAGEGVGASTAQPPWRLLWMVAWLGVLGHLCADGWNDYGVHPFWPVDNRWYYGDLIFILEPLLWLSLLPFAFFVAQTRFFKGLCVVLAVFLLGLCWSGRFMSGGVALWLTGWGVAWVVIQWMSRRLRPVAAVLAVIALFEVLGVFGVGRFIARGRITGALPADEKLLVLSTSPAPGNPFCWRVIMTSRRGSEYVARVGAWAMGPSDPATCLPRTFPADDELISRPVTEASLTGPGFWWAGELSRELGTFESMIQSHCRMRALLRFVRTPFWKLDALGNGIAGDLRYHSAGGGGFAEIATASGEDCYALEPPWDPPSGLIGPGF